MKVYILSSEKRLECYENIRMQDMAKQLGIELRIMIPENFELVIDDMGSRQIFYNEKPIELPDVFMPRYTTTYFAHMITSYFENSGVFVVNVSAARKVAKDKLLTLQLLSRNNIPVPKSILAKFPLNIDFI